jgi:hypothetical protein
MPSMTIRRRPSGPTVLSVNSIVFIRPAGSRRESQPFFALSHPALFGPAQSQTRPSPLKSTRDNGGPDTSSGRRQT